MRESVSAVGVLDKAVSILTALEAGPLSLADLAAATALPRATAHRLAVALGRHGLVGRDEGGRFLLGPRLAELAEAGGSGRRTLAEVARPALVMLRDATGESSQLYVADGDHRVCLVSLESPFSLRTIVPVGAALPMERGSAGAVLRGEAEVLLRGWAQSVEEREKGVASVSAPVLVDGRVVAAVSVSGPIERTTRQPGKRYAGAVVQAARAVERAMR
ncbi:MAG TPA: IclR family transcriptional regulator C-terminal domain-containing protein [Acidimicrobiales bacterium]